MPVLIVFSVYLSGLQKIPLGFATLNVRIYRGYTASHLTSVIETRENLEKNKEKKRITHESIKHKKTSAIVQLL